MTLAVEAPTDAQLDTIRKMCREREVGLPEVVASKREASSRGWEITARPDPPPEDVDDDAA